MIKGHSNFAMTFNCPLEYATNASAFLFLALPKTLAKKFWLAKFFAKKEKQMTQMKKHV